MGQATYKTVHPYVWGATGGQILSRWSPRPEQLLFQHEISHPSHLPSYIYVPVVV